MDETQNRTNDITLTLNFLFLDLALFTNFIDIDFHDNDIDNI